MRTLIALAIAMPLLLAGCASESTETESTTTNPATNSSASQSKDASATEATEAPTTVTAGMTMADVKKIKGAPADTAHEHGPNESEIDIWKYDDGEVRFVNGKVAE